MGRDSRMMKRRWVTIIGLILGLNMGLIPGLNLLSLAQSTKGAGGNLRIYFIDVDEGQATLFITPADQSLLIDTGGEDSEGHHAERIAAAVKAAGLKKIDYLLTPRPREERTESASPLLYKVQIGAWIDTAPASEDEPEREVSALNRLKRIRVNPGDVLPIVGMKAILVSANGRSIAAPLEGSNTPNPLCKTTETGPQDAEVDTFSIGVQVTFGKLKMVEMGETSLDKERTLLCPVNMLGHADLYVTTNRAWERSPAVPEAMGARVAILDDRTQLREGAPSAGEASRSTAGLETLWQLHPLKESDEHRADDPYIANLDSEGNFLELISAGDGSFDIYNSRTGATKHYAANHAK